MQTPWGNLQDLDLDDRTLAEAILRADKHQLVEGLVVECLFDQLLSNLPTSVAGISALDVETVIAHPKGFADRKIAVVWAREKKEGLGRYLSALEARCRVFLIEYQPKHGFIGCPIQGGKRAGPAATLETLLAPFAATVHTPFQVSLAVRDEQRQQAAMWGFLFEHHGKHLASRVLLPRILLNCGVQPWFKYIWNLDRVFIVDGKPWLFEVKHKFPFEEKPSGRLGFGLNNGEVSLFRLLLECGIGSLYSILVKPKWTKEIGSLYMMSDLTARSRTAVIAKVLDKDTLFAISKTASGVSGSDTTISGAGGSTLKFKPLAAKDFSMVGQFSDPPANISSTMVSMLRGIPVASVDDVALRDLQLPARS